MTKKKLFQTAISATLVFIAWNPAVLATPIDFLYSGSSTTWTVPSSGIYNIIAYGAAGGGGGGGGGLGAEIGGDFSLTIGQILNIAVGGGGGGGSFVTLSGNALVIAGGGGGGAAYPGGPGLTSSSGGGGGGGSGGSGGGGGGGFSGSGGGGGDFSNGLGGGRFPGLVGGLGGGGAGGVLNQGGFGGGGGSYLDTSATNPITVEGIHTGNGLVTIEAFPSLVPEPTSLSLFTIGAAAGFAAWQRQLNKRARSV